MVEQIVVSDDTGSEDSTPLATKGSEGQVEDSEYGGLMEFLSDVSDSEPKRELSPEF